VLEKIVTGGQSGVDRAALDAARAAGMARGGWCPRGRAAEDGPIASAYPLVETPTSDPAQRTAWNARDSDATLVLVRGAEPSGGTALALARAADLGRPTRVVDLAAPAAVTDVASWVRSTGVRVLNVAGPRESEAPGINALARVWLDALIRALSPGGNSP
jgi:hypothetical protein